MKFFRHLFIFLFVVFNSIFVSANNEQVSSKCIEVFKLCNQKKFDAVWDYWDWWGAGKLDVSFEQFDEKYTDYVFEILSCDEISNACEANREPSLIRYLDSSTKEEVDWTLSTPIKEGLKPEFIEKALIAANSMSQLRSLIIAKNGTLVAEKYYSRSKDSRPQHIQSITKSITSLLIGIAIDKNYITTESETVGIYFPDYFSKYPNQKKQNITIEQLLTMTSGLNFVDNPEWSKYRNTNSWADVVAWKAYWFFDDHPIHALSYDLIDSDDEQIVLYSTPACDVLTGIIAKASNMTAKRFADTYLFNPLGISNYYWYRDAQKNYLGGHTLFLRPRDLARIGQMILDGGKFKGRQIISQEWINKSFSTAISEFVDMEDAQEKIDYGYLWYLGKYKNYYYRFAWGYGGQMLFLIPSENILVVTTAFPDPDGYTHWKKSQQIIKEIMFRVIEST